MEKASAQLRAANHERAPWQQVVGAAAAAEHIRCICTGIDKQVSDVSERGTLFRNGRRNDPSRGKLTKAPPTKQNATAAFMQVCAGLRQFRFYSDPKGRPTMCASPSNQTIRNI